MVSKESKTIKKEFVRKTITITKKQEDWLNENWVSLSKFVQNKIEDVMSR